MPRVALVARADGGGLATLTSEFYRHVEPVRTLVVLIDNARGAVRKNLYRPGPESEVRYVRHADVARHADWLVEGVDSVYSAETWYSPAIPEAAARAGVRAVLHAMPELWTEEECGEVWAPTRWELERLPGDAKVVPVPVALDRLPYRRRMEARVLFHTAAPAFHDRNGTDTVLKAAALLPRTLDLRLLIRGPRPARFRYVNVPIPVTWLPPVHRYDEVIPDEADVMLLPRRYGGLSLPVQEAAARGLPVLMTDLEPQRAWFPEMALLPATVAEPLIAMRGGAFDVYGADPRELADRIVGLREDDAAVAYLSDVARTFGQSLSWDAWEGPYDWNLNALP